MKNTSGRTSNEQIEKEFKNLKKPVEAVSSESSKDSGKKSKTDSWTVNYLKTEFKKHDYETLWKPRILELCEKKGIKTISEFYDLLCTSLRNECSYNIWGENGPCWDAQGEAVAFGLDELKEAFDLKKDLSCLEVCRMGCCARVNRILSGIMEELYTRLNNETV